MINVKDYLGTKYICAHHALRDLRSIESDSFDIAGCILTTEAEHWVNTMMASGVDIIDSEDPIRNHIIQVNKERATFYADGKRACECIPKVECFEEVLPMINSLDENKIYTLASLCYHDKEVCIYLGILILILRPNIKLDITNQEDIFLKIIRGSLYRNNYEDVIASSNDWLVSVAKYGRSSLIKAHIIEKDLNVPFHIDLIGNTTWDKLLTYHTVIPLNVDKELPHWRNLLAESLKSLKTLYAQDKTIMDILDTEGD